MQPEPHIRVKPGICHLRVPDYRTQYIEYHGYRARESKVNRCNERFRIIEVLLLRKIDHFSTPVPLTLYTTLPSFIRLFEIYFEDLFGLNRKADIIQLSTEVADS